MHPALKPFDVQALSAALDDKRRSLGLSWAAVAHQLWDLSSDSNSRRKDHPISSLRWALKPLYASMDEKRRHEGLTWAAVGGVLGGGESRWAETATSSGNGRRCARNCGSPSPPGGRRLSSPWCRGSAGPVS